MPLVLAGEEGCAGGCAHGRVAVVAREDAPLCRHLVKVRGMVAAVGRSRVLPQHPDISRPEVVAKDEEDVGARGHGLGVSFKVGEGSKGGKSQGGAKDYS